MHELLDLIEEAETAPQNRTDTIVPIKAEEAGCRVKVADTATPTEPTTAANDTDLDPLPDAGMKRRRQVVLRMLRENPKITRAWVAAGDADPVIIHLAVRGVGTCELSIAADHWDEFKFLTLLEQQAGAA
jgi:hypothetical protein